MRHATPARRSQIVAGIAFALTFLLSAPAADAATVKERTIGSDAPVVSVSSSQTDGTVWALAERGALKEMYKVRVSTGSVITSDPVSSQASAIAQSPNGVLALGTSNGAASAVVLYSGASGSYTATVPIDSPAIDLAIGTGGFKCYVLEATRPDRTLFVFNQTHKGFSYQVGPNAIAIAPVNAGTDVWILQSNGFLEEMSLNPDRIVRKMEVGLKSEGLVASSNGRVLYVLADTNSPKAKQIRLLSTTGRVTGVVLVPPGSRSLAVSPSGSNVFDAVAESGIGAVVVLAFRP